MASPSNLPSARALAAECAARHEAQTMEQLDPTLHGDLEALAHHFRSQGRLANYFLSELVQWAAFFGSPNLGHEAIADFLLCQAIDLGVTTNVDPLVENSAHSLGARDFWSALDGNEAAIPRRHQPFLKLHGCCDRGRLETLWCHGQLDDDIWQRRLDSSSRWLAGRLTQRDILLVGYSSDWEYLNDVLVESLGGEVPLSVILFDPASTATLEAKAPQLWAWANRPGIVFRHERESADALLDELRRAFGIVLLNKIARSAEAAYVTRTGGPVPALPDFSALSSIDLYDVRRDWTGVPRDRPTTRREPSADDELLSNMILDLLARGATLAGPNLIANGKVIRLVRGGGRMLYSIQQEYSNEPHGPNAPEITVCVGAIDDGGVPANIMRGGTGAHIVRHSAPGQWCTHAEANALIGWN